MDKLGIIKQIIKVYRAMDGGKTQGGIITAVLVVVALAVAAKFGIILEPSTLVLIFAPIGGWIANGFRDAMKKSAAAMKSDAVETVKNALKSGEINLDDITGGSE